MFKKIGWKALIIVLVGAGYFGYLYFSGRSQNLNVNIHSSKSHPLKQEIHFTPVQVVHIFKQHHIDLTPVVNPTAKYDFNGIHPYIYTLNQNKKHLLYMYVFKSEQDRKKASNQIEAPFMSPFQSDQTKNQSQNKQPSFVYVYYDSWNILMTTPISSKNTLSEMKTYPKLKLVVFNYLNDGKTRVYSGKNGDWKGTFTYQYYQHWYKNQYDTVMSDGEGKGTIKINYTGSKLPLHNVELKYQLMGGGETLKTPTYKGHPLTMGVSNRDTILPVTQKTEIEINWDQQHETLTLKAKDGK